MTRNLLLSGGPGHEFDAVAQAISRLLRDEGIDTDVVDEPALMLTRLTTGAPATGVPYDLLTVHALHWGMATERYAHLRAEQSFTLRAEDAAGIERFVAEGGGLLALHTAVICFDAEPAWHALCGASWNWDRSSHPPVGDARVSVTDAGRIHPITEGLDDFVVVDEVYGSLDEEPGIVPLLAGEADGHRHPVLWAHEVGGGRVVVDTLGHDRSSIEHPTHRTILRRAATWARGTRAGAGTDAAHGVASSEPSTEEHP